MRRTVIGDAKLWVPENDAPYGVVLRGRHVFVVLSRGPKSVRSRALVSLTSIDPARALEADPVFQRAAAGLRSGPDLVFYAPARGLAAQVGAPRDVLSHLLSRVESIAIGVRLRGGDVSIDAWAGSPEPKALLAAASKPAAHVLFGKPNARPPFTAAMKMSAPGLVGLMDAWWQSRGAPSLERVYQKLMGRSFAADWRPVLTGALTVATAESTTDEAGGRRDGATHIAIGIKDSARARTLLGDMARLVPLMEAVTRGSRTTYWLRTDKNRRVPIRIAHGSIIITSGSALPVSVSSTTGPVPAVLRATALRAQANTLLVADASHLAELLLPPEANRARRMLPVPGPGAPLSPAYKTLIRELQLAYGTLARAEAALAHVRRQHQAHMFGALGTLELVATPGTGHTRASGVLRLRGASQALIHVALTASATGDAALIRLRKTVSVLTQRADELRTRARLLRQRDVADYLLRKQLQKPAPKSAPPKSAPPKSR